MEPEYPPQRIFTLILLGMGIFFLSAVFLIFFCQVALGAWRPYLVQIAVIAWLASLPLTYLIWEQVEKRHRP